MKRVLTQCLPILLFTCLWELSFWADPGAFSLFPPPSQFIRYLLEQHFSLGLGPNQQGIMTAILASTMRVIVGLLLSFIMALISGICICSIKALSDLFLPLVRLLAPIAPIAWLPLALSLFGTGDASAIFIVFIGTYFILVIASISAIEQVDKNLLAAADVLGAKPLHCWRYLIFPSILPHLFLMLRLNFIGAWMAVLAAEMVGLRDGLGTIILIGRESYNPNLILIGMVLIGVAGYGIDQMLVCIQRNFLWWNNPKIS